MEETAPLYYESRKMVKEITMRWIASIIWALIASFTTNGLIAFAMGGLDRAWVIVVVTLIWLGVFLLACPKLYDTSGRPTH